jgi:hypothetical protein
LSSSSPRRYPGEQVRANPLANQTFANPAPHVAREVPGPTRSPSRTCEWPCLRGCAGARSRPGRNSDRLRGVRQALTTSRTRARGARTAGKDKGGKVTIHTLRHTFASRLVQAGVSLPKVSKLLGHSSITTTEIYAHLAPNEVSEEATAVLNGLQASPCDPRMLERTQQVSRETAHQRPRWTKP